MCRRSEVDRLVILASCPGAMAGADRSFGATSGRSPSWAGPGKVKGSVAVKKNGGGRSKDRKRGPQLGRVDQRLVLDSVGFSGFGREGKRCGEGETAAEGTVEVEVYRKLGVF